MKDYASFYLHKRSAVLFEMALKQITMKIILSIIRKFKIIRKKPLFGMLFTRKIK